MIVDEPAPQPERWGEPELARLTAMVRQHSLFYWKGPQTTALLEEFRRHYALEHLFPCSSGSAAVHVAVAALRLKPGDEVIVPPITDMGTVIGVIYQQGVPVFADLDPRTCNLDPADVRRRVTARTRAIIAVHFAGNPCDLEALGAIARERGCALIEDCAQAWGAQWRGRPVGTIADIACYSFNDFKHLSCGDGGMVGSNDPRLGPTLAKWGDKYYDRLTGNRDLEEFAPNYRISEPQSAVAAAQMARLPGIASRRHRAGQLLTARLEGVAGLQLPTAAAQDTHSYWFYFMRYDRARFKVAREDFAAALVAEGVAATAGYIPNPVYRYPVFQKHGFFGGAWPIRDAGLTAMDYRTVSCPVAEAIVADCVFFRLNEAMSDGYIEKVAKAIRTVAGRLAR